MSAPLLGRVIGHLVATSRPRVTAPVPVVVVVVTARDVLLVLAEVRTVVLFGRRLSFPYTFTTPLPVLLSGRPRVGRKGRTENSGNGLGRLCSPVQE